MAERDTPALPAGVAGSGALDRLAETARDYARDSAAAATRRAYAADWRGWVAWCRRRGVDPLPPDPRAVGLHIADLASGPAPLSTASIERRLSGLAWNWAQRGMRLDRTDRHIASVLAGIRRRHGRPPARKAALSGGDVVAMADTLPRGLRGLRDRAILLLGFAGGLRRSEIVGLDVGRDDTMEQRGWINIGEDGLLVTVLGKTGWREVAVGRGLAAVRGGGFWASVPEGVARRRAGGRRAAVRPACRPLGQADGAGGRDPRRPARGGTGEPAFRPFPAGRAGHLGAGRRAPCPAAARPRVRGDDPALPARPGQVCREPHPGLSLAH